jgi:hypothetical protein
VTAFANARIPFHTGGPFTDAKLRVILKSVLKQPNIKKPSLQEVEELAFALNDICGAYRFSRDVAKKSNTMAAEVREALATLERFFEERQQMCERGYRPETIAAEQILYGKYCDLVSALRDHDFVLDMDVAATTPEMKKGWRDIALAIASAFKLALANSGAKLGLSNDGPVPRFVAAVIPLITGEQPTVINVGKHLKDVARPKKGKSGTTNGPVCPGTTN